MSAPISSFSKLSISSIMQTSRAARGQLGAKGKGRAVSQDDKAPSFGESSSDDELEDESEEDGNDTITDTPWRQRVFGLDHCRQIESTYAFQLAYAEVENYSIRIKNSDLDGITCSCDQGGHCRHTTWILDQISRSSNTSIEGSPTKPHQQILARGLDSVCEKLHWELRNGETDSDTEDTRWRLAKDYSTTESGLKTRKMIRKRMKNARDIMAVFSMQTTEDFRPDIFEDADEFSMDDIVAKGDLERTISKLLILNDDVFHHFDVLVSRDTRASEYFRKMGIKAQETCLALDQYSELGPVAGQHDLIWCAQTLVDIVDSISKNVIERQPLTPSSRLKAARALVSILWMVVKERNHDVYQNSKWPRRRAHGEPQIDRNLYQRLIGSKSGPNPAGGTFVLNALQHLPEARACVEDLEEILGILQTIGWGPAPLAYRDKLIALITQLKGSAPNIPSSGKRSAGSLDRKAKRMK